MECKSFLFLIGKNLTDKKGGANLSSLLKNYGKLVGGLLVVDLDLLQIQDLIVSPKLKYSKK